MYFTNSNWRCTVTAEGKHYSILNNIWVRLGGRVTKNTKRDVWVWTIHNKTSMIDLIHRVNGNIRNTIRVEQFKRLCEYHKIAYVPALPLLKDNAWIAGFFETDGSISLVHNKSWNTYRITISFSNKYYDNLEHLMIFNGNIKFSTKVPMLNSIPLKPSQYITANDTGLDTTLDWHTSKESVIMELYNSISPHIRGHKAIRINLIPQFYYLKNQRAYLPDHPMYHQWVTLIESWNQY